LPLDEVYSSTMEPTVVDSSKALTKVVELSSVANGASRRRQILPEQSRRPEIAPPTPQTPQPQEPDKSQLADEDADATYSSSKMSLEMFLASSDSDDEGQPSPIDAKMLQRPKVDDDVDDEEDDDDDDEGFFYSEASKNDTVPTSAQVISKKDVDTALHVPAQSDASSVGMAPESHSKEGDDALRSEGGALLKAIPDDIETAVTRSNVSGDADVSSQAIPDEGGTSDHHNSSYMSSESEDEYPQEKTSAIDMEDDEEDDDFVIECVAPSRTALEVNIKPPAVDAEYDRESVAHADKVQGLSPEIMAALAHAQREGERMLVSSDASEARKKKSKKSRKKILSSRETSSGHSVDA
jgi:hypothetical protein